MPTAANIYQMTGRQNRKKGRENQDAVFQMISTDVKASVLADGAGSSEFSAIGSRSMAYGLCLYMHKEARELMDAETEDIRYSIALEIERILDELEGRFDRDKHFFASTVMGAVFDIKRDLYCTIHVGDGMILSDHGLRYIPLSFPKNGICKEQTYLTTSSGLMNKIEIHRGRLGEIEGLVLISDGVYSYPLRMESLERKLYELRCGNVKLTSGEDDQSIVFMGKIS